MRTHTDQAAGSARVSACYPRATRVTWVVSDVRGHRRHSSTGDAHELRVVVGGVGGDGDGTHALACMRQRPRPPPTPRGNDPSAGSPTEHGCHVAVVAGRARACVRARLQCWVSHNLPAACAHAAQAGSPAQAFPPGHPPLLAPVSRGTDWILSRRARARTHPFPYSLCTFPHAGGLEADRPIP